MMALEKAERLAKGAQVSLRRAINEKCRDCIYDDRNGLGNWRQQVAACTVTTCPLYPVRPTSKPQRGGKKASQIDLAGIP